IWSDAPALLDLQAVAPVAHQVDRHRHREVAAHRRVEGHEHTLARVVEARLPRDHPIDDRLAVLGLARLKEVRVCARLDEVPLREGTTQPHGLARELTTDDEGGIKAQRAALQVLAIAL